MHNPSRRLHNPKNIDMKRTEKFLLASVCFTLLLLTFRLGYSGKLTYIFLAWNLFLAVIPLLMSRKLLLHDGFKPVTILLLACWLLFLPNAPYLVTDVIHFRERLPVPKWFDLLLVVSAAWNGLLLGSVSLMQVESFLSRHLRPLQVNSLTVAFLFLSGYGIYIGRFLRFNSWDVITDPVDLVATLSQHFLLPYEYRSVWKFTLIFTGLLYIVYVCLKEVGNYSRETVISPVHSKGE